MRHYPGGSLDPLMPYLYEHRSIATLALLGVAMALGASRSAHAASCALPSATVLPDEQSTDVPTNTRIWWVSDAPLFAGLEQCDTPPRLLDANGTEIPSTLSVLRHMAVLTPSQRLEPMEYTVEHGCLEEPGHLYEPQSVFTVLDGATEDLEAPETPDMGVGEPDVARSEGGDIVALQIEGEFEDILLLDIGGTATLDPDALTGEVTTTSLRDDFWLSSADCAVPRSELQAGTSTTFAFASFDLAGNFSGWTEPEPLTIAQSEGCQCSAAGDRPSFGWAALFLLGLVARRRRFSVDP